MQLRPVKKPRKDLDTWNSSANEDDTNTEKVNLNEGAEKEASPSSNEVR